MKLVIASDHAGFALKNKLILLIGQYDPSIEVEDLGPEAYNEGDDYPDYVGKVGRYISQNPNAKELRGVVIGGSGQGENICVNRYVYVRSVLIYGHDMVLNTKIAKLSREHNDANVISFGARFIEEDHVFEILKIWLLEPFSGDERHVRRLAKLESTQQ